MVSRLWSIDESIDEAVRSVLDGIQNTVFSFSPNRLPGNRTVVYEPTTKRKVDTVTLWVCRRAPLAPRKRRAPPLRETRVRVAPGLVRSLLLPHTQRRICILFMNSTTDTLCEETVRETDILRENNTPRDTALFLSTH